jgi:kinetochore protein NDC80
MGNLSRRSIGGGGNVRPSRPGLPYTSAVTKEARPIREKSYQQKEQREILEYLNKIDLKNQIPTLSIKTLQSPTAREFFDIWMRLVQELDPDYSLPPNKKVEDEFQQVMKDLLYPHAEQISRTSLATPNAPHAWPAILASLHWMVQTIEVLNFIIFSPLSLP